LAHGYVNVLSYVSVTRCRRIWLFTTRRYPISKLAVDTARLTAVKVPRIDFGEGHVTDMPSPGAIVHFQRRRTV
jgi:hypothetical protein